MALHCISPDLARLGPEPMQRHVRSRWKLTLLYCAQAGTNDGLHCRRFRIFRLVTRSCPYPSCGSARNRQFHHHHRRPPPHQLCRSANAVWQKLVSVTPGNPFQSRRPLLLGHADLSHLVPRRSARNRRRRLPFRARDRLCECRNAGKLERVRGSHIRSCQRCG